MKRVNGVTACSEERRTIAERTDSEYFFWKWAASSEISKCNYDTKFEIAAVKVAAVLTANRSSADSYNFKRSCAAVRERWHQRKHWYPFRDNHCSQTKNTWRFERLHEKEPAQFLLLPVWSVLLTIQRISEVRLPHRYNIYRNSRSRCKWLSLKR